MGKGGEQFLKVAGNPKKKRGAWKGDIVWKAVERKNNGVLTGEKMKKKRIRQEEKTFYSVKGGEGKIAI